jgi:hypothetical protein
MDMDMGNRLMGCRERWTFLLLARACVSTVKKTGWILVSAWWSREGMGQVMLSAATAQTVENHPAL